VRHQFRGFRIPRRIVLQAPSAVVTNIASKELRLVLVVMLELPDVAVCKLRPESGFLTQPIGANGTQSTVAPILLKALASSGACAWVWLSTTTMLPLVFWCLIGSGIGVFLLWRLSTSLAPLYLYRFFTKSTWQ